MADPALLESEIRVDDREFLARFVAPDLAPLPGAPGAVLSGEE